MTTNSLSYKLYTDHLEEVDFLLTQRLVLFSDPEVDWPEIEEFEKRLFAHIKGLVLGGSAADEVAEELLVSDDIDQIRAAVFALAHSKSPDAFDRIIRTLQNTSNELAPAFIDGLKHIASPTVDSKLVGLLNHSSPAVRAVAVATLGYRRTLDPAAAQRALQDKETDVLKAAASACTTGKLSATIPLLLDLLKHPDKLIAAEAALALSIYQMPEGYQWLRKSCQTAPIDPAIASVYLALNGRITDLSLFTDRSDEISPDEIEAIGIIGDPAAVPHLLAILKSDAKTRHIDAALALGLITGAPLTEEYTESEDFDDEDAKASDAVESTYTRISTSHQDWSRWWTANGSRFAAGGRYRNGQPHSTSALIAEIKDAKAKIRRRRLSYLELLINQAISEPFEADWFVRRQAETLSRW